MQTHSEARRIYGILNQMGYEELRVAPGLTIRQSLEAWLQSCGMFSQQAVAVMNKVVFSPENDPMRDRWDEAAEDYPENIMKIAMISVSDHADRYAQKHIPRAWWRPMFNPDLMKAVEARTPAPAAPKHDFERVLNSVLGEGPRVCDNCGKELTPADTGRALCPPCYRSH